VDVNRVLGSFWRAGGSYFPAAFLWD